MKPASRTLRIIGGNWRTRKVTFANSAEIRPTGDRIRETLFNWLMQEVPGSTCLDLFAGSGILGLEALSRGAAKVTFVDKDKNAVDSISDNLRILKAVPGTYSLETTDAATWLQRAKTTFDIVFVDPPFNDPELMYSILSTLAERHIANQWVYVESAGELDETRLPHQWVLHREKRAGSVHYSLLHIAA